MTVPPPNVPPHLPPPSQPIMYQQSAPARPPRPFAVTFVAVIALLIALADILTGIGLLAFHEDSHFLQSLGLTPSQSTGIGAISIVLGAVTLMLSIGLFGGSRLSRAVIAFIAVVRIAVSVVVLILPGGSQGNLSALVEIFISACIIALLYAGDRTSAFFR